MENNVLTGFTFYRTIYESLEEIPDPIQRLTAFEAIFKYGYFGIEPDFEGENAWTLRMAFKSHKHTLDKARANGENGKKSNRNRNGIETESNQNRTGIETETKQEQDKDIDIDKDIDKEIDKAQSCSPPPSFANTDYESKFEQLWEMYPKKAGNKQKAFEAYVQAREDGEDHTAILLGLNSYKGKIKALETPEQYILNAATFFTERRWKDDFSYKPKEKERPGKPNPFNDFPQHEYDFEELEKDLLPEPCDTEQYTEY